MQKLRTTFKRSKTPTGADMKQQSSLEVPKQVRSASFDEIEFGKNSSGAGERFLLSVPAANSRNQRSRSLDSGSSTVSGAGTGGSDEVSPTTSSQLDVPRLALRRRSSGEKSTVGGCIHCAYLEELELQGEFERPPRPRTLFYSSSSSSEAEEESESGATTTDDEFDTDEMSEEDDTSLEEEEDSASARGPITVTLTPNSPSLERFPPPTILVAGGGVTVVSLEVPVLPKQQRSASIDACFLNKGEGANSDNTLEVPKTQRSKSIDVALPTDEQQAYKAISHPAKKAIQGEILIPTDSGEQRTLRSSTDWNETAINGDHIWVSTSASGDFCYVGDNDCSKQGPRMKCAACKIIAHTGCINHLIDKVKFTCKPTFRDVGIRQYREQTIIHHHWVHRRNQKGKCRQCSKSFQSKLSFSSKDIVAISCSWCKAAYHNKESCFNMQKIEEQCTLGIHAGIIVPPSWIVKLPRKGSFKSSLRKSPKKRGSTKRKSKKEGDKEHQRTFVIKPIPTPNAKPVIVFINPRSGGNQGAKLMQKFQWLLNPRQVFDLTQGGPRSGLEMYKKVPNLRILACGGDGTVGWVLSVLDEINVNPPPAVAVLPLGTGNDLARALGWGGGYTDEPISKILCNIEEGDITQLDRWDLKLEKNLNPDPSNNEEGKESLPLNVVNNYFSLGADAYIALEFHEAREAHPEKFNSRLRNKMFYGQAGGKDLLQRKWKDLSEYVTLECDGKDVTPKLKELKVHAILFLNIHSYGGGTHPWNSQTSGFEPQRTDDGLIEIIGLTTYQLPLLQAGGHGTSLAQCKHAKLITTRTIPMQVDGEPCKLAPSIIELKLRNQANMVAKAKHTGIRPNMQIPLERLRMQVSRISMTDYENYHYDKEKLRQASIPLGIIVVDQDADLEQVRLHINRLQEDAVNAANSNGSAQKLSPDWCFLDSCTAERFFRIDRAQENLHYVTDISSEDLYILDPELVISEERNTTFEASSTATLEIPSFEEVQEKSTDIVITETPTEKADSPCEVEEPTPEKEQQMEGASSSPSSSTVTTANQACLLPTLHVNSNVLERNSEEIIKSARSGDLKLLKDLHMSGYSLLSIDQYGMTALHHAARYGHRDIVRYLIASAPVAILNMVDNEKGQTALHKAAAYKRRTICCMLVAAGASLTIADHEGLTARQQALIAEDKELAAYLESQEHFQLVVSEDQETAV